MSKFLEWICFQQFPYCQYTQHSIELTTHSILMEWLDCMHSRHSSVHYFTKNILDGDTYVIPILGFFPVSLGMLLHFNADSIRYIRSEIQFRWKFLWFFFTFPEHISISWQILNIFRRKLNFSLNSNFPTNFHCIFGRKISHNIQNDLKTLESSTYQRFKPLPSMYRHSVCDAVNNISMLCLCKKHIDVGPDYLNSSNSFVFIPDDVLCI